jgi:small-conductance mechanosensitive channel
VSIIRRIAGVLIVIVALSAVLLRFEGFRQLGTGLLASAGIAGIVIGFAAQRTIGNLIAGFQLAVTQPIRVDDVMWWKMSGAESRRSRSPTWC